MKTTCKLPSKVNESNLNWPKIKPWGGLMFGAPKYEAFWSQPHLILFSFFFFSSLPFSHQTEGNTSIQLQLVQHTVLLFLVDFCKASRAWSQPCSFTEPTPTQTRASLTGRWARLLSQLWLPGSRLFFFSRLAQPSSFQCIRLTEKGWVLKGEWFSLQRFDTLTNSGEYVRWAAKERNGTCLGEPGTYYWVKFFGSFRQKCERRVL